MPRQLQGRGGKGPSQTGRWYSLSKWVLIATKPWPPQSWCPTSEPSSETMAVEEMARESMDFERQRLPRDLIQNVKRISLH